MNPFDLRGPEFLLFYFVLASVVLLILILLRRLDEQPSALKPPLDDPYLVAFLRGGEDEALHVTALSLIDRGLLKIKSSGASIFSSEAENRLEIADPHAMDAAKRPIEKSALESLIDRGLLKLKSSRTSTLSSGDTENRLELTDPQAIDAVQRPIEKSVLEAFKTAQPAGTTLQSLVGCKACIDYAVNLEQLGLLPGPDTRAARNRRFWIAIAVLLGVAVLKILIALSRGRTNILFLILMTVLAAYATSRVSNSFRTERGEKFLEDVRSLFGTLRLRADSLRPGGATTDLVWLASAFGLAEVSPVLFPQVSTLVPRKPHRKGGEWSFDGSCGTSGCGGGGCGGGGCGGGGCGGCGS